MELEYSSRSLEKACTNERVMKKTYNVQIAKTLKLRIAEMRRALEPRDLLNGTGRWEELEGDRSGQWSARLSGNYRLIMQPVDRQIVTVLVIEVIDYHKK